MTFILRVLSAFVGLLPEPVLRFAAGCLSWLVFSVFRYRRKVIAENIAQAFGEWEPSQR